MGVIFSGIGAALSAALITFLMNYIHHIRRDRKSSALNLYEAIETARHDIGTIAISMSQVARKWSSYESSIDFLLQSGVTTSPAESRMAAIVALDFPALTQRHQEIVKKIKEINEIVGHLSFKNSEYQNNETAEKLISLKDEVMDISDLLRNEALEIAREPLWNYMTRRGVCILKKIDPRKTLERLQL
ncbi:hypothetical protein [Halomonas saccharevitans]|uniref:hypothetical protein n=1 Tax=Halomonas saccharevitans TaxID=416872 RepID=UPI0011135DCF|nr:hypothetical protein [Halomonas saccharevitans]